MIERRFHLVLIVLALLGAALVVAATSRYGAGLSPDSATYAGVARSFMAGEGFVRYDGTPLVGKPPLYSVVLGVVEVVSGAEFLEFAHLLNALLFGLIVYLGGRLALRYGESSMGFALAGTLSILLSVPLFAVSVWMWSEALFICATVLAFLSADSYLSKKDALSLAVLSLSVAVAVMTRYIGVALVLWGALIVVAFHRDTLRRRIAHASIFLVVSTAPLAIWIARNYAVSGTALGPRASSKTPLSRNLELVVDTISCWYAPCGTAGRAALLLFLGATVGMVAILAARSGGQRVRDALVRAVPPVLFVAIYIAILVVSSTTTAYDEIDDRLLSPVYVPLTLALLVIVRSALGPLRERLPARAVYAVAAILVAVWLVHPGLSVSRSARDQYRFGQGYGGKAWAESQTIRYLREHDGVEPGCQVYTNDPYACYILANLETRLSPTKREYQSLDVVDRISTLEGSWPAEGRACLVWFTIFESPIHFSPDELRAVATIEPIVRFEDGAIYVVTREE